MVEAIREADNTLSKIKKLRAQTSNETKRGESASSSSDPSKDENKDVELGAFSNFEISKKTIKKLKDAGINHLFPVQYDTFNHIKEGKDVIVQSRTGTGKTLGFALPILEGLREKEDEICSKVGRAP